MSFGFTTLDRTASVLTVTSDNPESLCCCRVVWLPASASHGTIDGSTKIPLGRKHHVKILQTANSVVC